MQLLGKKDDFGGELRFTVTSTEGLSGASLELMLRHMPVFENMLLAIGLGDVLAELMVAEALCSPIQNDYHLWIAAVPGGTTWGPQEVHDKQVWL